jgi:glycine/D-amino acid oxidase-like deaminating enzyme
MAAPKPSPVAAWYQCAVRALVIGGGIYGWSCALRLAQFAAAVTVVDPRPVGDTERASGGTTRVLRLEYGDETHYSELTLRARSRWREIEAATGADLYREVGVLLLVPDGDDGTWERDSLAVTAGLDAGGTELGPTDIARRWPAIRPDGIAWGAFNPVGGFLFANRATVTVAGLAQAAGVSLLADRVGRVDGAGADLASGTRVDADVVVLTAGAWSAGLVPNLPIRPTRQLTAYLAGGPGDIPVFGDGAPFAMYGMPAHDGFGMKIGAHLTGPDGDPDDPRQRVATESELDAIRGYARTRFGLTADEARIERADVCFYAMTPTEDPVVDRLDSGVVVCAGFSGHGFKFAPVVAVAAAELAIGRRPSVDLGPFRLTST